ncbi:MAG: SGNH/GDSL hydrolase family protein [Cyanobacteria bacterium SZAS-4]|nr:SGNH/GDSL hydrolase family protein [Cyanobacteria bacterium SZAS-4]
MKVKIAKKQFEILPNLAVNYLLFSIVGVLVLAFFIDAVVITTLEDQGKICSSSWRLDHHTLNEQMKNRNRATEKFPLWSSDEFPVSEKCPKAKRILIMGDSFVWGHGHANLNTIWWRQLQRELQRRGYNDVEVIAAGMVGAPTRKEFHWAEMLVPIYKPDALIFGYVLNDPDEGDGDASRIGYVQEVRLPPDEFPARCKALIASVYPNLADELFQVLRTTNRGNKLYGEKLGTAGSNISDWELMILQGKNWQDYTKTVEGLGGYLKTLSIPAFVVTLPCLTFDHKPLGEHQTLTQKTRDYYRVRYQPVEKLFEKNNIKWYDSLEQFLAFANQDARMKSKDPPLWLGITPNNGHPGPLATHAHAYYAADVLEKYYPQVLGPKTQPVDTVSKVHINDVVPPSVNFKQNDEAFFFVYPSVETEMLTMPIRKPYVQLNLENPVAVSKVTIDGAGLKNAELYISSDDPVKHFDDATVISMGKKNGGSLTWNLPVNDRTSHVNTFRVVAEFKGLERSLLMKVTPCSASVSPR